MADKSQDGRPAGRVVVLDYGAGNLRESLFPAENEVLRLPEAEEVLGDC